MDKERWDRNSNPYSNVDDCGNFCKTTTISLPLLSLHVLAVCNCEYWWRKWPGNEASLLKVLDTLYTASLTPAPHPPPPPPTHTHTHTDSGVGAGIDSYYEYCLKSYILLGDREYLRRFDKVTGCGHWSCDMRTIGILQ